MLEVKNIKIIIFIILILSSFGKSFAHQISFEDIIEIKSDLQIENNKIFFNDTLSVPLKNMQKTKGEINKFAQSYYDQNFFITHKNNNCKLKIEEIISDGKNTITKGFFTCKEEIYSLEELNIKDNLLIDYPHNSKNIFLKITDKEKEKNIILTDSNNKFVGIMSNSIEKKSFISEKNSNYLIIIKKFIKLGINHILEGTDHILFLIALILTSTIFKNIIVLATGFTISHSITLVLTGLGLVTISSNIVEPLIALSIIFMAVWDLKYFSAKKLKKINKINKRILITLFFGLFHGLGFADALSGDNIIPKDYTKTALFSFNVGIELGQILIILLVFPLILFLRKKYDTFGQKTLQIISICVLIISTYWFFERVI